MLLPFKLQSIKNGEIQEATMKINETVTGALVGQCQEVLDKQWTNSQLILSFLQKRNERKAAKKQPPKPESAQPPPKRKGKDSSEESTSDVLPPKRPRSNAKPGASDTSSEQPPNQPKGDVNKSKPSKPGASKKAPNKSKNGDQTTSGVSSKENQSQSDEAQVQATAKERAIMSDSKR